MIAIHHFFIQGFDRQSTIKDVLSMRLVTLEDAIRAALQVEEIDKENKQMVKRVEAPILAFIPINYCTSEPIMYHPIVDPCYGTLASKQPIPLASRDPTPLLTTEVSPFRSEIQQIAGMKDEMLRAMNEKMQGTYQTDGMFGMWTSLTANTRIP